MDLLVHTGYALVYAVVGIAVLRWRLHLRPVSNSTSQTTTGGNNDVLVK